MKNIQILEWVAAVTSISGGLLVAYQYKSGWWVSLLGNLLWIHFNVKKKQWGVMVLILFNILSNIIGLLVWK